MFSPLTGSLEERLELIRNSMSKDIARKELEDCESLEDFFFYSEKVRNEVLSQMQIYVLDNYKKVPLEVWNKRSFGIKPHLGGKGITFGKTDEFTTLWKNDFMKEMSLKRWKKSVKIESIEFTLDEWDGDFSVDFNNGTWSFIYDDEIRSYYLTVKKYLDGIK